MKALEFRTQITAENTLALPPEISAQLSPDQTVRVLLLVSGVEEKEDWNRLTAEQFLMGYAESDAIYDQLPTR
jgi:hypothetical protein